MRHRWVLALSLVLALIAPAPTVIAADLNSQIQQAGEDLDNANAAVSKAMSAYRKAQAELDKATAVYNAAKARYDRAHKADLAAAAALRAAEARTEAARKKIGRAHV